MPAGNQCRDQAGIDSIMRIRNILFSTAQQVAQCVRGGGGGG